MQKTPPMHSNESTTCFAGPRVQEIGFRAPGPENTVDSTKQKILDNNIPLPMETLLSALLGIIYMYIYIYIYTTAGLGPRKNKKMAGVYNFLEYLQTAQKCSNTHKVCRAPVVVCFAAYVSGLHIHQPFSYFF